ncbi:MAG: PepSY-like domain-containing protein, partial [Prevotella sp.]|nr:PepSY-like domain-containing protein [Prevotella sp.]
KYEVMLNDGAKIDFDKRGNWDKVDCETYAVPAALIPASIAQYVKTNFPGTIIIKIDKERYGYDIELSNDIELKFNQSGALIGMDD